MTTVVPVTHAPGFAPRPGVPAPDRLIAGSPTFSTWEIDSSLAGSARWGQVRTGIWEATPGETRSIKGSALEFCHILSGKVEITSDAGDVWIFGAGDSFVMKPGFVGRWRTIETVRKIYVFAEE
jgi:hypothetical protein